MHLELTQILVLAAFFELAQQDQPVSRPRLAAFSGVSRSALEGALEALERAGWVNGEALHLTLPGLAVATAVRGRARQLRTARALAA